MTYRISIGYKRLGMHGVMHMTVGADTAEEALREARAIVMHKGANTRITHESAERCLLAM